MAKKPNTLPTEATSYQHPESDAPLRPEVGAQPRFKKKKPPVQYRYDSSLSPALEWDENNPARDHAEALLKRIEEARDLDEAKAAARELLRMSRPFLNWSGKAERAQFEVPTLPLFIHERLSTKAIIETLKTHKRDKQLSLFDFFSDPQATLSDQVLRAYEHRTSWTNRMILGDSLVVMNSLLNYEGLGGQVQMIYMDPPYGVRFNSNFQPFVRKRDVKHGDDDHFTREPEMVKAYRDTWHLGLHSYLTYLRDRFTLSRDLLTPSGSIFVQISDENVHHVRELMDEVFGVENYVSEIIFTKTTSATSDQLATTFDFILWYAKDKSQVKFRRLYQEKTLGGEGALAYNKIELPDGTRRALTKEEKNGNVELPLGAKIYTTGGLTSQRPPGDFPVEFEGKTYRPGKGYWKTGQVGFDLLKKENRLEATSGSLRYVRYYEDFPFFEIASLWSDTGIAGFTSDKLYIVQTSQKVLQRCLLMVTDPGDLVLDPTCGSGTTAFIAEQWGRRWITIDASRVPLALARQRLLTATFPWYELKDPARGPAGGFVYRRKQNKKGEEVGGIVPHITLKSIANNEPPQEEVLVDRPETETGIVRVTGPFTVEAVIPTPMDMEAESNGEPVSNDGKSPQESLDDFTERMLEVLRLSPVLHEPGKPPTELRHVRRPARTMSLSAEAVRVKDEAPVAIVFGPEHGAVPNRLVEQAAREANAKQYKALYVIGFAFEPTATETIAECAVVFDVPAFRVEMTPDLMMGDLLKTMRSSQIFSVCGLPEVEVNKKDTPDGERWQVSLVGLDVFEPSTMQAEHLHGNDVPAWLLDTDYNGMVFHVCQAFFPRTAAWDSLKKALKATHEESVWDHLAGTTSAPFEAGEYRQIAVKVIDDRGNELIVVKSLK